MDCVLVTSLAMGRMDVCTGRLDSSYGYGHGGLGITCSGLSKCTYLRPNLEGRESSAAAILPVDVIRDCDPDGIRIAQVKTVEFGIRVLETSSPRSLRRNPVL
jgi:hypothetical protein